MSDRLSFDPERLDAGIPENAPDTPVGSLDELNELGMNTEHFRCCSKRNKATGVLGCQKFGICPLSIKGKEVAEGGGPRRLAWERIFRGQPIQRREGSCWKLADDKVFVEDNHGAVRIIAMEGGLGGFPETYQKLEGVAVKTIVNAEGNTEKVLAKDGEAHLPNVQRQDMVVTKTVRPFVRPSQNADIAVDVITADVIRKEHERISTESVAEALGVSGGGTPLDKRDDGPRKRKGQG